MSVDPYDAAWLLTEERSPRVVLEANPSHWNSARGPRLQRVVFRNDLSPAEALEACLAGDGEVDIVTEVSPADAERVKASEHAELVTSDANRVLLGILNRDRPLLDRVEVRQALNLAVDKQRLVDEQLDGYASVIAALTPPWCSGCPKDAQPYPHDPDRARALLQDAGWPADRPLVLATLAAFEAVARALAAQYEAALQIPVQVAVVPPEQEAAASRALIEKKLEQPFDVLLFAWFDLSSEAPPAAVHRSFFGRDGAFRVGPLHDGFDKLFAEMAVELDGEALVTIAERIDQLVFDEALAVFLCAPQALYAVNKHVSFGPYRTTFELAECTVDEQHWSVRGSAASGSASADRPGFAGAAGNAC